MRSINHGMSDYLCRNTRDRAVGVFGWVAVVVATAFGAVTPAFALDVCRSAKTETDVVSGETTTRLYRQGVGLKVVDGEAIVQVSVSLGGLQGVTVPAGTPVLFVLENGARVSFQAYEDIKPVGAAYADQYSAGVYSTWQFKMPLSAEAAHTIAQSRPLALRVVIGTTEKKVDYSERGGRQLQGLFACAAQVLSSAGPSVSEPTK